MPQDRRLYKDLLNFLMYTKYLVQVLADISSNDWAYIIWFLHFLKQLKLKYWIMYISFPIHLYVLCQKILPYNICIKFTIISYHIQWCYNKCKLSCSNSENKIIIDIWQSIYIEGSVADSEISKGGGSKKGDPSPK
jgi:hypothetical protein